MNTAMLITARLKSKRLPMKVIAPIQGRPVLAHMIDRLKLAARIDRIIVCTSTNPQDDPLEALAQTEGVDCFRGDEDDVLKRLYDAANAFNVDYILNITADCPFTDPEYADRIVETYKQTDADLITALGLPHGAYSYGIKPEALSKVIDIKESKNTEVWGRYFTDSGLFNVYDMPIDDPLHKQPDLRMTLDYPEDLEFFEAVFEHLYKLGEVFSLDDILHLLEEYPEIVEINRHCEALYEKRVTKQSAISLKQRYDVQRVAILGCGSIGQRHIRNLRSLGITDIVALRSRQGHFQDLDPDLKVKEVETWDDLLASKPDAAIISNPTSLHLETAAQLAPHVRGIFIEKPLGSTLAGVENVLELIKDHKVISFVGFNLQFHPAIRELEKLLGDGKLGKPLVFQCQVGQWLPDWHPYEDHRQAYYARRDLAGGVMLTLIHEVHLALELLGAARAVSCILPNSELLPLDVDVIADLQVQHHLGTVSQIHLDFIQRQVHRSGVLSCERGWVSYDLVQPKVTMQADGDAAPKAIWEDPDYEANQPYLDEMRLFIRYVREGRMRHEFDAWRAVRSLAVVDASFLSAQSRCMTELPDWVQELD